MKKNLIGASSVFVLFLAWVIAEALVGNEILMPGPLAVFKAVFAILTGADTLMAIGATILRLLLALSIALISGLLTGVAAGLNGYVAHFMRPFITILRTVPVVAIIIILLILFGFSQTPYIITFLMIFPLIYQATDDGIRNIDSELIDVYKLEDDRFFSGLLNCYLPLIGEQIKTAFLQSAGLGIKVLIMAEYLAQTRFSIGNMLYQEKINLRFDYVFGWTVLLILMAIILESMIRHYVEKRQMNGITGPKKRSKLD
jgi:NitT/TauT family transport system permease protein